MVSTFTRSREVRGGDILLAEMPLSADVQQAKDRNFRETVGRNMAKLIFLLPLPLLTTSDARPEDTFTINNRHSPAFEADSVSVMTANVHGWETAGGNNGFEEFEEILIKEQPDVVCLQEAIADRPVIEKLVKDGDYNLVFATTTWQGLNRQRGNAILSKASIISNKLITLPHNYTSEPRNAISTSIKTTDGWLRITGTHLSIDSVESMEQSKKLNSEMYGDQILCGDFNQGTNTVNSGPFEAGGGVGGKTSPRGSRFSSRTPGIPTFPNVFPVRAIDHIFACSEAVNARTVGVGSDHRALIAEFDVSKCVLTPES